MATNIEENQENFRQKQQSAFVVGYTGEVGKELVKELARTKVFKDVLLVGRRKVTYEDPELQKFEQKVIDFDKIEEHADAFKADVGFICLGTTRGKSGADGFYRVDHDYVVNTAKLAKEGGSKHISLVSSQGASKNSWFLYPKTKGVVEETLKSMGFERVTILRPALLMCDRTETRGTEAALRWMSQPMLKYFPTVMTTPTSTVAKAMVNDVVTPHDAVVTLLDNKAIFAAAGELSSKK